MATGSLKSRTISGAIWSVLGQTSSQILRLASNLIMTRLLVPEAFGLMALLTVFLQGLQMFSDVGIRASIVQNPRGEEPEFLNTAWTFQILRGALLWLATIAAAWPMATAYGEPIIFQALPAVGLSALLAGVASTSLATQSRHMRVRSLILVEVGAQIASIIAMVAYAMVWPTVWALVVGGLVNATVITGLSHFALPGIRNRFRWEPSAARELFRFGRWIFLSTALTFFINLGDRLLLSTFVPFALLGIYSIAVQFSMAMQQVLQAISGRVLFPLYSRSIEQGQDVLRFRLSRVRAGLLLALVPLPVALTAFGDVLVRLLYEEPYWDAGWMLQILSIGAIAQAINLTVSPVVLASGDSLRHLGLLVATTSVTVPAMLIGGWVDGVRGFIIGLSASRWLVYPALVWAIRKTGMWMPWVDLAVVLYAAVWYLVLAAMVPRVEIWLGPVFEWIGSARG